MADPRSEDGNQPLLGTKHDPSMRILAWSRQFPLMMGVLLPVEHDHMTYDDALFCGGLGRICVCYR